MCKFNSLIITILCLSFLAILSIGCSKDDSNPVKPKINSELVGIWKLSKLTIVTANETTNMTESQLSQMGGFWTITLKDDATFETTTNIFTGDTETDTGTWNSTDKVLTLIFSDGAMAFEYSIVGNVLTLKWNDIEDGEEEDITGEFKK